MLITSLNIQANQPVTSNQSIKPIFILQQANNIPLSTFVQRWPQLEKCISTQKKLKSVNKSCLTSLLTTNVKAATLNLESQIARNNGNNQHAIELISKAIEIEPKQDLHYFQLAINNYQQLLKSTSGREKWMLSMATAKAYKKAFELDPTQFHYRYYITYNYLQVPEAMGGSKQKALDLANEAIAQGYVAFHPVRADILNAMNKKQEALDAYVLALESRQYKRSSFKKAMVLAKNDPKLSDHFRQFIQQAETIISKKS